MAFFCETKIKMGLVHTDKADVGQAGTVAAEGLIRAQC